MMMALNNICQSKDHCSN